MSAFNGKQWVQLAKNESQQKQHPVQQKKVQVATKNKNTNTVISNDPLGTETYGDKPYIKCYDCFYAVHCGVHSNRRRH